MKLNCSSLISIDISIFKTENVKDINSALEGAGYIIAEWISDNASYRKWIRNNVFTN